MPDISLTMVVVLCLAALAAGWIDAVVGGGGLLLLPALLLGLPASTPAAYALGTNKAVAIVGTSGAAVTYARKAPVDVRLAVRIGLAALAGSSGGAFFAAGMSTEVLKPVIMVVLLAVAAFVILRPAFGTAPATGVAAGRGDGRVQPGGRHARSPYGTEAGQRIRAGGAADGGVRAGGEAGVRAVVGLAEGYCLRSSSSTMPVVSSSPCPAASHRSMRVVYGVSSSALTPCSSAVASRVALPATCMARLDTTSLP